MKPRFGLLSLLATLLLTQLCFVLNADSQANPRRIEVTAKRFSFTPNELTVKKGEPTELVLTSEDVTHSIRIKELGVDLKATKGQTSDFTFTPNKTGDFVGHCANFCGSGHGSMKLTVHVVD